MLFAGATLSLACNRTGEASDDRGPQVPAVRALVDKWIAHLEAGQYDSLTKLVTPNFRFRMDDKSYATPELLSLLHSFNPTDVHIEVDSITTRVRGDSAFVNYTAFETYTVDGVPATEREVGSIVAERRDGAWRFSEWTYDSAALHEPVEIGR